MDITSLLLPVSFDCLSLELFAARDISGCTELPRYSARRPWLCHLDSDRHQNSFIRHRSGAPTTTAIRFHNQFRQRTIRQHDVQDGAMSTGSNKRQQQVSDLTLDCPMPSESHAPPLIVILRTIASHLLVPD
jgi:hypothetical protein